MDSNSPLESVLDERPKSRLKLWLWISSLSLGIFLGVAAALFGSWLWAKNYLESPRLWADISSSGSLDVTAGKTHVKLFPPQAVVTDLEAKILIAGKTASKDQTLVAHAKEVRLKISTLGLLIFNLNLNTQISDVEMDLLPGRQDRSDSKSGGGPGGKVNPFAQAGSGIPQLPFRHVNLEFLASRVKLPVDYLPVTDVAVDVSLASGAKGAQIELRRASALGLAVQGSVAVDPRGAAKFELALPEKESLISGKIDGDLSASKTLSARGELKLPTTPVEVPKGARWDLSGKPLTLDGSARLAGDVGFNVADSKWSATAAWDLDLTPLAVNFGPYRKAGGWTTLIKGKFSGDSTRWSLSDFTAVLGRAKATMRVDSSVAGANAPANTGAMPGANSGFGTHIVGSVAPFEIAEFLPLILKGIESSQTGGDISSLSKGLQNVSGRASAKVDLTLPASGTGQAEVPSGTIDVSLDRWVIDGGLLAALAKQANVQNPADAATAKQQPAAATAPAPKSPPVPLEASGKLELDGVLSAQLENGTFRRGSVRLDLDATPLELKYGTAFEKRRGIPLVAGISGDGSGKQISIKSAKIEGPQGVSLQGRGKINDLRDFRGNIRLLDSKIPLKALSAFFPSARGANGWVKLSGELQGSLKDLANDFYANLDWEVRGAAFAYEAFRLKTANAKLQTILGGAGTPGAQSGAKTLLPSVLLRVQHLTAQCAYDSIPDFSVSMQGNTNFASNALTGELTANVSPLDLKGWLAKKMAERKAVVAGVPQGVPTPAEALENAFDPAKLPINFRQSKFVFTLSAPLIRTPYGEFSGTRGSIRVGGGSDVEVEKLASRAFGGDLLFKSKIKFVQSGVALGVSANGQDLSMPALADAMSKLSGKPTPVSVFGRGDLEVSGAAGMTLAQTDLRGKAEIRDGGFKFLPLPGSFLDSIKGAGLLDRVNLERDGQVSDRFERAQATFALKADKMDLTVVASDSRMNMAAKGYVTLDGKCDLAGKVTTKPGLVGGQAGPALERGLAFASLGDAWNCTPKPDLKGTWDAQKSAVVEKVQERVQEKVQKEVGDKVRGEANKVIQNSLKNIFGN